MKKEDKSLSTLRTYLLLTIVVVSLVSFIALLRAYFISNQNNTDLIQANTIKYNDPLQLSKLPTFSSVTINNPLPNSDYEIEDTNNLWISLDTDDYKQLGYLNKDLKLTILQVLPKNVSNIKVYKDDKFFFILEAENGNGPSLIFKQANNAIVILSLNPDQFFTGYYYSATENLFYISTGNSGGIYTLFTLKQDGTKSTLLELSQKFEVIKATSDFVVIKQADQCQSLNYLTKKLTNFECSNVFLNSQQLNLITSDLKIELNKSGNKKTIYEAAVDESIGNSKLLYSNIYFVVYKVVGNTKIPNKVLKSDLNGVITEVTTNFSQGDIDFVISFGQLLLVDKYFGVNRLLKFQDEAPSSFPVNSWSEVNLLPTQIYNIEILGADYQIY